MPIPLEEWDRTLAPRLRDMLVDLHYVMYYVGKVCGTADAIRLRPNFFTNAEAALEDAVDKLKFAVTELEDAKSKLATRPTDV